MSHTNILPTPMTGTVSAALDAPAQWPQDDTTPSGALRVERKGSSTRDAPYSSAKSALSDASVNEAPSVTALAHAVSEGAGRGPFVPLVLVSVAVLAMLVFQSFQLFSDRQALHLAHANQQAGVDTAAKLRASLDAFAADTQRLADAGNANARLLVEELKKRGVTINPAAAAGAGAGAGAGAHAGAQAASR